MNNKFKDIPLDPETKILSREEGRFLNFDCVFEKWVSDGIYGDSLIFFKADFAGIGSDEIIKKLSNSKDIEINDKCTISEKGDFLFINYKFEAKD